MKIFRNVFMVAAALMMGLASCNNEGNAPVDPINPGTPEGAQISVRFAFGGTRVIGDSQSNEYVVVNNGVILLVDNTGLIRASRRISTDSNDPNYIHNVHIFEAVPAGVNSVYFTGNTALTDAQIAPGQTLASVRDIELALLSQRQAIPGTDPTFNVVNVWGGAEGNVEPRSPQEINQVTGAVIHEAHVVIRPTVARVEMFNITGNEHITSFQVTGVFMDTFYENARVGGAVVPPIRQIGCGTSASIPMFAPVGFLSSGFVAWHTQTVYDAPVAGGVWGHWPSVLGNHRVGGTATAPVMANVHRVVPPGGEVWGYNLFANNSTMPRMAIRLANVFVREVVTLTIEDHIVRNYEFAMDVNNDPVWVPNPSFNSALPITPDVEMHAESCFARLGLNPVNMHQNTFLGTTSVPGQVLESAPISLPHPETRRVPLGAPAAMSQQDIQNRLIAGDTPAEVLALLVTNVQARSAQYEDSSLFISINSFRNALNGNDITHFLPGHVYQLGSYTSVGVGQPGGSAWTFGPENTTRIPFRAPIDVHVTVEIMEWIHVPSDPVLGT